MSSERVPRGTLVQRLNVEITAQIRSTAATLPDDEMIRRLDELFTTVGRLAHAPALNSSDLDVKLTVLCRQLREHLDPDDRGAVLTYLLAEAVRDDHLLLTVRPSEVSR